MANALIRNLRSMSGQVEGQPFGDEDFAADIKDAVEALNHAVMAGLKRGIGTHMTITRVAGAGLGETHKLAVDVTKKF